MTLQSSVTPPTHHHSAGGPLRNLRLGSYQPATLTRDLNTRTIALGQHAYFEQTITRFNLKDAQPAVTPTGEPGSDLTPGSDAVSSNLLTPSGENAISQDDWLPHVRQRDDSTRHCVCSLGGVGYSDTDWASHLHRNSISGFAQFTGAGVVSWSAKTQPITTLSSTEAEAEYVALSCSWSYSLLFLSPQAIRDPSLGLSGARPWRFWGKE